MPTLHVRNVPDSIYERVRERAKAQNRSLSAEVVVLLDYALAATRHDQGELLAGIRRRRFLKPVASGAPDAVTLLRQDRER